MRRFLLGRFAGALLSLLGVSIIVFYMSRMTGSPVDVILGPEASMADRDRLTRALGLDQPLHVQYWRFVSRAATGDLGTSTFMRRPVAEIILARLPASLQLGLASFAVAILIAVPMGVYSAVKRGSLIDASARMVAVFGQSIPQFWLGLVLILIFAVQLDLLPTGGHTQPGSIILPSLTMAWYLAAGVMRLIRSSMIETLNSEYVLFARLQGVPETQVIWKHAFINAAVPVLTFSTMVLVLMLTSALTVELIFGWPGLGSLVINAVAWRDYPLVQGIVLVMSLMFIVGNFLADTLYGFLNPKIRFGQMRGTG